MDLSVFVEKFSYSSHTIKTGMVMLPDDVRKLVEHTIKLQNQLDKIESILNRNLTTDNKVYYINVVFNNES